MATRRRRRGRPNRAERQSFTGEIDDWEFGYRFSADNMKLFSGAYWEYSALELKATFLEPEKVKGRVCSVVLLGDRRLTNAVQNPNSNAKPLGIGTLTVRGSRTEYLGSIPLDVFSSVVSALAAGRLKFMTFSGPPLLRGSSSIDSVGFYRQLSIEEL
jgi:hypothetical protein